MPSPPLPLSPLVIPPRLGSPDWGYAYERQPSEASSVNPEADTELDQLRKENSDLRKCVDCYKHNMQCLNRNFGDRQATVHCLHRERNELRATLANPQNAVITNTLCDQLRQQLGGQFNDQLQARDRRISDLEHELAEIAGIGMRYYMADALPFMQDLQGAICDIRSRANFGLPDRGSMVDEEEEAWVCDTLLDIEHLAGCTTHLLEDATALVGMFRPSHSRARQEDLARLSTYAGDYYCPGGAYGIALNNPLCRNGAERCPAGAAKFPNKRCRLKEAAAEAQEDESNNGDEEDGESEG
ncbi:hypothetical protein VNI00_017039 [Paramarasmius palmivorus]|uniref:Uncharacterized protein n=1 Tax=Paramarasmius palmivorus TaxID=297713 RepID=A0AAW0B8K1_9AGAR